MVDLSKAEQEVKDLVLQGMSSKDVAERLFVTEKTVKFHLTNIYKKLGVNGRSELIAKHHYTYTPKEEKMSEINLPTKNNPVSLLPQDSQMQITTQREKINFIDEKFRVGESISQLHHMMKEVTKERIDPNSVNAACNCVSRINETINTAIQAARFLSGR